MHHHHALNTKRDKSTNYIQRRSLLYGEIVGFVRPTCNGKKQVVRRGYSVILLIYRCALRWLITVKPSPLFVAIAGLQEEQPGVAVVNIFMKLSGINQYRKTKALGRIGGCLTEDTPRDQGEECGASRSRDAESLSDALNVLELTKRLGVRNSRQNKTDSFVANGIDIIRKTRFWFSVRLRLAGRSVVCVLY